MLSRITQGLTDSIVANIPGITTEKAEQIEYGLYMAIADLSKVSLIIIISAILGIFKYVLIALAVFAGLRMCLGGTHAKTHLGCILSYAAFIFGSVYLSMFISVPYLNMVSFPIAILTSFMYAPADLPSKPIISKKQRKRLRTLGLAELSILWIITFFTTTIITNIISITTLLVVSMLTPLVYKITGNTRSNGTI